MTFKHFPLIIIGSLLSVGVWFLLPVDLELARKIPAFFATISMISMALAMVISCRPKWIEPLVGGMDKAYIWHKWLGIFGLLGASFHWMLVPGPAGNALDPQFAEMGEEIGQWAMYGLLLLGGVSMVKQIPYRIWFYTHKLMGPIFLISIYHTFFSDVPFELFSLTGAALVVVSLIGSVSWVYKTFMKPKQYCAYQVTDVNPMDDAVEVVMKAEGEGIQYHAGQFAYLDFGFDRVEHFHPFTITSAPEISSTSNVASAKSKGTGQELSFVIRGLGRHTKELQSRLNVGLNVTVDGGYGRLHAKKKANKPQVWIAGGIGITPFLAWIRSWKENDQPVHLFYVGRGSLYSLMLEKVGQLIGSKRIILHKQSAESERLTAEIMCSKLDLDIKQYQWFACGPTPMLMSLKSQLVEKGMKTNQWHNENFSMR
ncbi:ferredoxin reductase family protein [Vibrio sp. 99-70-13A1]|uniref:ferredoxin reductase family protein n=1 Tax=Vibrio sp. 99-70-13A1 TaxID=2607601 RepID=UPI0014933944|nr:ferredoxin reductase family protein [Vibrio sp. 99-70-13A1]NOH96671.1 hypothetical protein [Vibrio sp. 99-70-13A1]